MERLTEKRENPSVNSQYIKRKEVWTSDCIEKLGKYEQAEEDGLLIRLPIEEGAEVYVIVQAYTFGEVGDEAEEWYSIHSEKFDRSMVEDFGKTVFLTKAEAEQALSKMKGV